MQRVKCDHPVQVVEGGGEPAWARKREDEGAHAVFRLQVDAPRPLPARASQRGDRHRLLQGVEDDPKRALCPLDRAGVHSQHVARGARMTTLARLQAQDRRFLPAVARVQNDAKEGQPHAVEALLEPHALVTGLDCVAKRQIQRSLQNTPPTSFGLLIYARLFAVVDVRNLGNGVLLDHGRDVTDDANSHRTKVMGCEWFIRGCERQTGETRTR